VLTFRDRYEDADLVQGQRHGGFSIGVHAPSALVVARWQGLSRVDRT
jgi:hypothetical protein